ncbi:MAG TPA: winged helix-turn-helix transcriptional regulator [bacterium]|jgi:DNA-binding HxlR family transcriptional regulator|nr:winged helix-turn-helix transcriptional regulator [bacterium]
MTPSQPSKVVALRKPKSPTGFHTGDCAKHGKLEHAVTIGNVLRVIGGKWKVLIVFHLAQNEVVRFGELKRKIPGVTQRILTNQLREMEADGLINRKVYPEVPPKVEYSLSDVGSELKAVYMEMKKWGEKNSKLLARIEKTHESELKSAQG